jgi:hypothetical protein
MIDANVLNEVEKDFIFNPIGIVPTALGKDGDREVPKGKARFRKAAKNADHPLTVDLRRMKNELGLTTKEMVKEMREFEQEHGFSDNERHGTSRDFIPMTSVLMSSYLQGWVLQTLYMEAVHERLKKFHAYKMASLVKEPNPMFEDGITKIFDKWFKDLGIADKNNPVPIRTFARVIAPFYKRPVTAKFSGTFLLGDAISEKEQYYFISENKEICHTFLLNRAEKVLVENGSHVNRGDLIQYSVLYRLVSKPDGSMNFDLSSPSADHTTFFRWYTTNNPPRSMQAFELVKSAVESAIKFNSK